MATKVGRKVIEEDSLPGVPSSKTESWAEPILHGLMPMGGRVPPRLGQGIPSTWSSLSQEWAHVIGQVNWHPPWDFLARAMAGGEGGCSLYWNCLDGKIRIWGQ